MKALMSLSDALLPVLISPSNENERAKVQRISLDHASEATKYKTGHFYLALTKVNVPHIVL
ncbi:hypothetical protein NTGM5_30119 [Candidatus Nitrotoga sp. M5]|nr:hypothetical protein NTGM5_30119 [Candidatus Nitrotoga sp. M5]